MRRRLGFPYAVKLILHHLLVGVKPVGFQAQMQPVLRPAEEVLPQGSAADFIAELFHALANLAAGGFGVFGGGFLGRDFLFLGFAKNAHVPAPLGEVQKHAKEVGQGDGLHRRSRADLVNGLPVVGQGFRRSNAHFRPQCGDIAQPLGSAVVLPPLLAGEPAGGFFGLSHAAAFGGLQRLLKDSAGAVDDFRRDAVFQRKRGTGDRSRADVNSKPVVLHFRLLLCYNPNCITQADF